MPTKNRFSHSSTRKAMAEITSQRKALQKEKEEKEKARKPPQSFADMQAQNIRQAKAFQRKYPDLSLETVANIIIYAKELPKERGSNIIDDCIFMAQMGQHFDITNITELERMYKAVARMHDTEHKKNKNNHTSALCRTNLYFHYIKQDCQNSFCVFSV